MKKYRIEVSEVLSRVVEVVAEDDTEALQIVKAMYRNCDLILDASDYVLTEFSVIDE
ncbi:MAG: DpnD/PcfM family protein [Muribaculaceae bacterium]|nr:DpnD/PcfM family protein [Muribaculaceae bacterium]